MSNYSLRTSSISSSSSHSLSSTIPLLFIDSPCKLANPLVSFYNDDEILVRPSYFQDFVYLMPPQEYVNMMRSSAIPRERFTSCETGYMHLPSFSDLIFCDAYVKIFDCTHEHLQDFDSFLVSGQDNFKYGHFDYIFDKYRYESRNYFGYPFYFDIKNEDTYLDIEDPFRCVHATSLLKGATASIYSAYQFCKFNISEQDVSRVLTRWSLELLQLGLNFSPLNLIFSFLKLLNEWFDVTKLLEITVLLFDKTFSWLSQKLSKQPSPDQCVVPTMLDLTTFASVKDSTPALASALASLCVLFGTIVVGKEICSSNKYDTLSQKLAETMTCMSKFRSGFAAIKDMLGNFSNFMYEVVFDLLGLESDSELLKLVRSVEVVEHDNCKKELIFDYCKFLCNPSNLVLIQSNNSYRQQLDFSYSLLESIRFKIANESIPLPITMINYISSTLVELQKVRKSVSKTSAGDSSRFCPFWINFVGESHTGKSTFTSIFSKYFMNILEKAGVKEGVNFDIPSESNRYYSVNFCDKFETNYTGQYVTLIDDFAQDGPGAAENSSALKMVNWISSIPYFTNQAQLDNKGIPFTSKLIISTSNDLSLRNRKEIISVDALVNRMSLCFKFSRRYDNVPNNTPWFPKPVKIELYDFAQGKVIREVDVDELTKICVQEYIQWYKKEMKLETYRKVDKNVIDRIVNEMYPDQISNAAKPLEVGETSNTESTVLKLCVSLPEENNNQACSLSKIEATSRMKCYFGLHPGYKEDLFDCNCDYHRVWNENYVLYKVLSNDTMPMDEFISTSLTDRVSIRTLQSDLRSSWNSIAEAAKRYLDNPYFKLIAGAVGMLLAGAWAYKMYQNTEEEETIFNQVSPSAKYTIATKRVKARKTVIGTSEEKVIHTSGFESVTDMFNDAFCSNAIEIARDTVIGRGLVCRLESSTRINTGLRIHGNAILTNHHFMNIMEEGSKWKISYSDLNSMNHTIEQIFNKNRMYRIPNTDLVVYNCDNALPVCRSIIKHFPEEMIMAQRVKSLVLSADPLPVVYANVVAKPCKFRTSYTVGDTSYDTLDSWETNCPVKYGMSGSVLFSTSNMDKHKIIGIQTCKNNNGLNEYGYFKPVSQKQLKEALIHLGVQQIEQNIDGAIEATCLVKDKFCPPNLQKNSLTYLGTVPKAKQIRSQNVSKLIPSMVHDPDTLTQLPSVLSDYDERMDESLRGKPIIFRAIEGFDHAIGSIDNNILDKSVNQLKIEYDVLLDVEGISRRVLNNFEMVNGIPGVMLAVDMKTSPGYPYVLERKNTTRGGKFEWFNEMEEIPNGYGKAYTMTNSLLSGVEQAEQQLKDGLMPSFIAYCCLKDETRPVQKIIDGKTRAFICLPLHFNLLVRKYFGAFTSAQKKQAAKISSCVGIDPANDWVRLFNKLNEKNSKWEDFDYANWDQHLHPELVMRVADIVNHWYNDGEQNAKVRKFLIYNLIHTLIIVKDRLFLKQQGQCSGCAITAELNCLVHDLLMVYVWNKLHQDQGIPTDLSEMREQVALCVYGDDIIMSVDPDCDIKFNGTTIAPIMSELGMNITPGDKISTTFELKPPNEIFFLKRNFVLDGEKVLAPLRSDIVENIIQWIHKSDDLIAATHLNCVTALQESYMHRKAYYNKLSSIIHERVKLFNRNNPGVEFPPVIVDYEELDRKYYFGRYVCAGLDRSVHAFTE